MALTEYIRHRRLTMAALALQDGSEKIIDLALKSGVKLKAYPRISFQISVEGDKDMDYRIVDKPEFKVNISLKFSRE